MEKCMDESLSRWNDQTGYTTDNIDEQDLW